eukprot:63202-Chlamydomonas_euryale.AAC.1
MALASGHGTSKSKVTLNMQNYHEWLPAIKTQVMKFNSLECIGEGPLASLPEVSAVQAAVSAVSGNDNIPGINRSRDQPNNILGIIPSRHL